MDVAIPVAGVEMLRALLRGDFEAVDRHVYEVEWDVGTGLLHAAFWIAVNRRFPAATAPREISRYVAELHDRYDAIETRVAESLIRAACGEEHLVDGLAPETALPTEMLLVYELVGQQPLTDGQLEEFIADTLRLAPESFA